MIGQTISHDKLSEEFGGFCPSPRSARPGGLVCIRTHDGQAFTLRPETVKGSPLDVDGADLGLTRKEIVISLSRTARRGVGQ